MLKEHIAIVPSLFPCSLLLPPSLNQLCRRGRIFLQKPKNISFDINVEVDGGYAVKRTLVTSDKFSTRGQNLHFNALFMILQRTAPKTWYVLAIIPQLIRKYPAGKFIQDEASK